MTTQVHKVRTHLEAGKTITPAVALMVYGIYRLSSVIEDLRNVGLEIDCVMKFDEMGKQYGEYRLRQPITAKSKVQIRRGHGYGLPNWVRRLRAAEVMSVRGDTAYVKFVRGKNVAFEWLNHKELVNAD